ncbi:MAG: LPP20 family lipoprotein [Betaproteobacteria bacterium]|nr:LPP20 family lipoprotein [Betaproteobacteria bacterium]
MMQGREGMIRWVVAVSVVMGVAACAKPKPKVAECTFPGSTTEAPGWVCDQPVPGVAVGAVGSAAKSGAGMSFMREMAGTSARAELARQMKVTVQGMIKQYAETTGAGDSETVDKVNTSVTKQITNESLSGSKIMRSIQAPDGTLFVLVGVDEGMKEKIVKDAVKTSLNNERAAWQQFKAKKGFEELAEDISKQKAEMEKK